jgi:uncharacterized protein (DUF2147 family)
MAILKRSVLQILFVMATLLGTSAMAHAQADKIEGFWLNEQKDAKIMVYKGNDGKFYGKIVWLKEPTKNGKPKVDEKNPKEKQQSTPLVGLIILKGFDKDGENGYDDGTIYDPQNGKTYDCTMTYKGKTLSIRGYVGISWFGRTTVWERAG